ncbi:hypothetical protein [Yoonia sp. SS1-5]|uniref:Uncharacterized protein n=1 Tax=Yoonia rhodophyticola TaxID=3137370 RepID=A0AAN0NJI7_9RHOB
MKHEPIQTKAMSKICTSKSECGKLKVEQETYATTDGGHAQLLDPASPVLAGEFQGQDGQLTAPLHRSDAGKECVAMSDESLLSKALEQAASPSIEIDVAKYQAYLDDPALTDAQKEEIISALWSIMTAFVDLGFGVHPVQQAIDQEACGHLTEKVDQSGETDSNDPKPNFETLQNAFNAARDDT